MASYRSRRTNVNVLLSKAVQFRNGNRSGKIFRERFGPPTSVPVQAGARKRPGGAYALCGLFRHFRRYFPSVPASARSTSNVKTDNFTRFCVTNRGTVLTVLNLHYVPYTNFTQKLLEFQLLKFVFIKCYIFRGRQLNLRLRKIQT